MSMNQKLGFLKLSEDAFAPVWGITTRNWGLI